MNAAQYHRIQSIHCRRHGMSTLYVLIYVTLATGVMAATGQLLHSVMRASDVDRRLFHELQMTQLVAARLREDMSSEVLTVIPDALHLDAKNDVSLITWSVTGHMLTRAQHQEQKLVSRSHFRFRHGTRLQFQQENDQIGTLRITSPPLAWLPSTPTKSAADGRYVDIVLAVNKSAD